MPVLGVSQWRCDRGNSSMDPRTQSNSTRSVPELSPGYLMISLLEDSVTNCCLGCPFGSQGLCRTTMMLLRTVTMPTRGRLCCNISSISHREPRGHLRSDCHKAISIRNNQKLGESYSKADQSRFGPWTIQSHNKSRYHNKEKLHLASIRYMPIGLKEKQDMA